MLFNLYGTWYDTIIIYLCVIAACIYMFIAVPFGILCLALAWYAALHYYWYEW